MTKTVMFNPYTGTPRHPSDISSDPQGLLILEPGAPLRAAQREGNKLRAALERIEQTQSLATAHRLAGLALRGLGA